MPDQKNIRSILNQVLDELDNADDNEEETPEYDKEELIDDIRQLNHYNNTLHESANNIKKLFESISNNALFASHHLIKEVEKKADSFATNIVTDNAKQLKGLSEKLKGVAESIREPVMKGIVLVEEIGALLNRYYKIE